MPHSPGTVPSRALVVRKTSSLSAPHSWLFPHTELPHGREEGIEKIPRALSLRQTELRGPEGHYQICSRVGTASTFMDH